MRAPGFLLLFCLCQQSLFAQAVAQPADKPLYSPSLIATGENGLAGITPAAQPDFPFTATVEIENQTLSPRGEIVVHHLKGQIARDALGNLLTVVDLNEVGQLPIPSNVTIHIYDASRKAEFTVFPASKYVVEYSEGSPINEVRYATPFEPIPTIRHHRFTGPVESIRTNRKDLGVETLDGQVLRHGREVTSIPASPSLDKKAFKIVLDDWYAQNLQTFVRVQRRNSNQSVQTVTLRDIRRGNPPASLFHIPEDYKVTQVHRTEGYTHGYCPVP